MSTEADLFSALKSLVGNRMSPVTIPQPPAVPVWPAIRYTIIDAVPVATICGDGTDETDDIRVQLDIMALTYAQARSIRAQVRTAMKTFSPPAVLDNTSSEYDAETKVYRERMDYLIHGSSS